MNRGLKPSVLTLLLGWGVMLLSSCSVGMITDASQPVRVRVGTYNRAYGYYSNYSNRVYDPFYGSGYYGYGDSFYGAPLYPGRLSGWSDSSGSCNSRNCPSEVIRPATTQEAFRADDLSLNPGLLNSLNLDLDLNVNPSLTERQP